MNKELPINLNYSYARECWITLRLIPAMSDNRFIPWFIENFNTYYVDENLSISHHNWSLTELYNLFNEILTYECFNKNLDIFKQLELAISNNKYLLLYCDRYYMKNTKQYQHKHEMHEILIHGYDNANNTVNYVDIYNNKWGSYLMSYDELKRSFNSTIDAISGEPSLYEYLYRAQLPATIFSLNTTFQRNLRIDQFYESICYNIEGKNIRGEYNDNGELKLISRRYGVSVYKSYYEDLYKYIKNQQYERYKHMNILTLIETKKNLIIKLNEIRNYLSIKINASVFDDIDKLLENLIIARNLFLKYIFSNELELIEEMRNCFIVAEELDIKIMQYLKNILGMHILANLYKSNY